MIGLLLLLLGEPLALFLHNLSLLPQLSLIYYWALPVL